MAQRKILIVDDEKLVRWALAQKCAEYGYQAIEAESAEEALRILQAETVELTFLDVHLPEMSGIELLEKLKLNGDTRNIIMMTADPRKPHTMRIEKSLLALHATNMGPGPVILHMCCVRLKRDRWRF